MIFEKVAIVPKLNAGDGNKAVSSTIEVVEEACRASYLKPELVTVDKIDETTLVIAVGGDGTMIEAMRLAYNAGACAVGINLGNVGFLTDFNLQPTLKDDLIELLDESMQFNKKSEYEIERRMVLRTFEETHVAFNEYVISSLYSDQVLKYHLKIGEISAGYHRANGLIIASPTGSTAYSLSVGGGLLLPSMQAMQVVPIAPIGLTSRPIIVPGNLPVTVTVVSDQEWTLKADGQLIETKENKVSILQARRDVRIVHTKNWSFFKMLTDKLGWKTHG